MSKMDILVLLAMAKTLPGQWMLQTIDAEGDFVTEAPIPSMVAYVSRLGAQGYKTVKIPELPDYIGLSNGRKRIAIHVGKRLVLQS